MARLFFASLVALAPIALTGAAQAQSTPTCEGSGAPNPDCPCIPVNNAAVGSMTGCLNSTGLGALMLSVAGTGTSITANVPVGVQFVITNLPPQPGHLILVHNNPATPPFTPGIIIGPPWDGVLCVGGGPRVDLTMSTGGSYITPPGTGGTMTTTQETNFVSPGYLTAGGDAHFQMWYRDVGASSIGCVGANFSNAATIIGLAP